MDLGQLLFYDIFQNMPLKWLKTSHDKWKFQFWAFLRGFQKKLQKVEKNLERVYFLQLLFFHTLNTVIVQWFHSWVIIMLEHNPVRVGWYSLLGRRVKIIGTRVVFIRWSEVDRMFFEPSEYCASWHEPTKLISLKNTYTILDINFVNYYTLH